jgi:hypothetical protein
MTSVCGNMGKATPLQLSDAELYDSRIGRGRFAQTTPLHPLWSPLVPCPELIKTRVQRVQAKSSQRKDRQHRA